MLQGFCYGGFFTHFTINPLDSLYTLQCHFEMADSKIVCQTCTCIEQEIGIIYPTNNLFTGNPEITLSVCLSVNLSLLSPSTDLPILMKLYTFVEFDLRKLSKEDNPSLKYFKGDNSREIISSAGLGYPL